MKYAFAFAAVAAFASAAPVAGPAAASVATQERNPDTFLGKALGALTLLPTISDFLGGEEERRDLAARDPFLGKALGALTLLPLVSDFLSGSEEEKRDLMARDPFLGKALAALTLLPFVSDFLGGEEEKRDLAERAPIGALGAGIIAALVGSGSLIAGNTIVSALTGSLGQEEKRDLAGSLGQEEKRDPQFLKGLKLGGNPGNILFGGDDEEQKRDLAVRDPWVYFPTEEQLAQLNGQQ